MGLPQRRGAGLLKLFALLVVLMQLGLVAHRIEHYLVPDQMECGEDGCDAFSPTPHADGLPVFIPPVFFVVFFVVFWTVLEAARTNRAARLGFRAHAPPL